MNARMSSSKRRRLILGALASSLVLSGMAGFTAAPARADEREWHGDRDRREHAREEEREHRREEWREHHERRAYVPGPPSYVYAPPPVYVPPPPSGINLVFPIEIR